MQSLPKIIARGEQPYVAIKSLVTMQEIEPTARQLFPELFNWVGEHRIRPAGAPFFKYNVIDMEHQLEIEFGLPTTTRVTGDARVFAGSLPSGRYASLVHRGPYETLYEANAALIGWATERNIKWDASKTEAGERFSCRLEIYLTDPKTEPDPEKWESEVTIRLADFQGSPGGI